MCDASYFTCFIVSPFSATFAFSFSPSFSYFNLFASAKRIQRTYSDFHFFGRLQAAKGTAVLYWIFNSIRIVKVASVNFAFSLFVYSWSARAFFRKYASSKGTVSIYSLRLYWLAVPTYVLYKAGLKTLMGSGMSKEAAQVAYIQSLNNPNTFDKTMRKEIAELER